MSFNIENKVLLHFRNIKITRSFKKWNHKYYDSFEIELSIEKQIYRFRLLKTFRSIYNVFHVSLLKFHRKNFEDSSSSVLMKEKEQWKMKKVLNSRIYYDKFQYFVKWLKYSDTDNEWLKHSEFDEIQELIRDLHEKYFDKSAKEKSNRKIIKIWFYWAFLIRSRHTYITLIIII